MKPTMNIGLGFLVALSTFLPAAFASAQTSSQTQPQSSLGDYARKVQKDPSAAKAKPKIYDNDNLPKDDKLSVVGQPAAVAKPAEDDKAKKEALWKEWQSKITEQKNQIELASRELDVTQREYQLRAAAMYADTGNRLRNEAQWDKQDAEYKQKIADKQKAVDDAKQKLSDMQEEARKAGVPSTMID